MSYRIQVDPDASVLLRTLSPHVVLGIGRALAELAEVADAEAGASTVAASAGDEDLRRIDVADCTVLYEVDGEGRSLIVRHVEEREDLGSQADIAAPSEAVAS